MKLSDFNEMSKQDQWKYIKAFVDVKPRVTNALVFEGYTISFTCTIHGEFIRAQARAHDHLQQEEAKKLLKGQQSVLLDLAQLPQVKHAVERKLFSATHRHN